jgi:hypothetical protein
MNQAPSTPQRIYANAPNTPVNNVMINRPPIQNPNSVMYNVNKFYLKIIFRN